MSEGDSKRAPRRRVTVAEKAAFVGALREGASRDEAAATAGRTWRAFYHQRRKDPLFDFAYRWAMELNAADERRRRSADARAAGCPAGADAVADLGMTIAPANRRRLQRCKRRVRFTEARKRIFLDHFAGTGDAFAAAKAAGVSYSTVWEHRRTDAAFAAAFDEALAQAYAMLEVEAVRQRLEAQRQLREGLCPTGEVAKEFERVLQLMARYERKNGRIGMREARPGHQRRMSFDEAFAELDRRLRSFGVRQGVLAPPEEGGPGEQGRAEDGA
jgi:hypothetical protein